MLNLFRKFNQRKPSEDLVDLVDYETEIEYDENVKEEIAIAFKNDSQRLRDEFTELDRKNPRLADIIEDLNDYAVENFGKGVLITMIYRTQAEQDYLYRNSERYRVRKFKSPHQFWHGVDLRSRTFNPEEIAKMVEYINNKYNEENYYRFSADYHTVGAGYHFHINFVSKK